MIEPAHLDEIWRLRRRVGDGVFFPDDRREPGEKLGRWHCRWVDHDRDQKSEVGVSVVRRWLYNATRVNSGN